MDTVTVSAKGEMIIPARLRHKLGISAGSRLYVLPEIGGCRVTVEPAKKKLTARELAGMADYTGARISEDEMDTARFAKTS